MTSLLWYFGISPTGRLDATFKRSFFIDQYFAHICWYIGLCHQDYPKTQWEFTTCSEREWGESKYLDRRNCGNWEEDRDPDCWMSHHLACLRALPSK